MHCLELERQILEERARKATAAEEQRQVEQLTVQCTQLAQEAELEHQLEKVQLAAQAGEELRRSGVERREREKVVSNYRSNRWRSS